MEIEVGVMPKDRKVEEGDEDDEEEEDEEEDEVVGEGDFASQEENLVTVDDLLSRYSSVRGSSLNPCDARLLPQWLGSGEGSLSYSCSDSGKVVRCKLLLLSSRSCSEQLRRKELVRLFSTAFGPEFLLGLREMDRLGVLSPSLWADFVESHELLDNIAKLLESFNTRDNWRAQKAWGEGAEGEGEDKTADEQQTATSSIELIGWFLDTAAARHRTGYRQVQQAIVLKVMQALAKNVDDRSDLILDWMLARPKGLSARNRPLGNERAAQTHVLAREEVLEKFLKIEDVTRRDKAWRACALYLPKSNSRCVGKFVSEKLIHSLLDDIPKGYLRPESSRFLVEGIALAETTQEDEPERRKVKRTAGVVMMEELAVKVLLGVLPPGPREDARRVQFANLTYLLSRCESHKKIVRAVATRIVTMQSWLNDATIVNWLVDFLLDTGTSAPSSSFSSSQANVPRPSDWLIVPGFVPLQVFSTKPTLHVGMRAFNHIFCRESQELPCLSQAARSAVQSRLGDFVANKDLDLLLGVFFPKKTASTGSTSTSSSTSTSAMGFLSSFAEFGVFACVLDRFVSNPKLFVNLLNAVFEAELTQTLLVPNIGLIVQSICQMGQQFWTSLPLRNLKVVTQILHALVLGLVRCDVEDVSRQLEQFPETLRHLCVTLLGSGKVLLLLAESRAFENHNLLTVLQQHLTCAEPHPNRQDLGLPQQICLQKWLLDDLTHSVATTGFFFHFREARNLLLSLGGLHQQDGALASFRKAVAIQLESSSGVETVLAMSMEDQELLVSDLFKSHASSRLVEILSDEKLENKRRVQLWKCVARRCLSEEENGINSDQSTALLLSLTKVGLQFAERITEQSDLDVDLIPLLQACVQRHGTDSYTSDALTLFLHTMGSVYTSLQSSSPHTFLSKECRITLLKSVLVLNQQCPVDVSRQVMDRLNPSQQEMLRNVCLQQNSCIDEEERSLVVQIGALFYGNKEDTSPTNSATVNKRKARDAESVFTVIQSVKKKPKQEVLTENQREKQRHFTMAGFSEFNPSQLADEDDNDEEFDAGHDFVHSTDIPVENQVPLNNNNNNKQQKSEGKEYNNVEGFQVVGREVLLDEEGFSKRRKKQAAKSTVVSFEYSPQNEPIDSDSEDNSRNCDEQVLFKQITEEKQRLQLKVEELDALREAQRKLISDIIHRRLSGKELSESERLHAQLSAQTSKLQIEQAVLISSLRRKLTKLQGLLH